MKFRVHQYNDLDLTIHEATEPTDTDDITSLLKDFYRNRVTTYLIWDLNKGGNPELSIDDIREINDISIEYGSQRKAGKTAIVTDNDLYFGLSRMYEIYAEIETALSLQVQVFREFKHAIAWFGINVKDRSMIPSYDNPLKRR
jgi:hypothetical protein